MCKYLKEKGHLMKKFTVLLLVMMMAGTAIAGIKTTKPLGPLVLNVLPDGTGEMTNAGAAPFLFDGYTILSDAGLLGDVFGINDNSWADPSFPATIGLSAQIATAFQEFSVTPNNYSEITMKAGATLQPGGIINLGATMLGLTQADGTFTYVDSTSGGSWEGEIIPEPATMSLLGLGALAMIRRRR